MQPCIGQELPWMPSADSGYLLKVGQL